MTKTRTLRDRKAQGHHETMGEREEQIEHVMGATVGLYGNLQEIAKKLLQKIEGLSFPSFE